MAASYLLKMHRQPLDMIKEAASIIIEAAYADSPRREAILRAKWKELFLLAIEVGWSPDIARSTAGCIIDICREMLAEMPRAGAPEKRSTLTPSAVTTQGAANAAPFALLSPF